MNREKFFQEQLLGLHYHELHVCCAAAEEAMDAIHRLQDQLDAKTAANWPSFFLLKKHCLQLAVQSHKALRILAALDSESAKPLQARLGLCLERLEAYLAGDRAGADSETPVLCTGTDLRVTATGMAMLVGQNDLPARISHALQGVDASTKARTAAYKRVHALILGEPPPTALIDALAPALAASALAGRDVTLWPRALAENGKDCSALLLPRLLPSANAENLALACRDFAAERFTPTALLFLLAHGLRHERVQLSLRCCAASGPLPKASIPSITPHFADSPLAQALVQLGALAGVAGENAHQAKPATFRRILEEACLLATAAFTRLAPHKTRVQSETGIVCHLYGLEAGPTALSAFPLAAPLLACLPDAESRTANEKSVLLGQKYGTLCLPKRLYVGITETGDAFRLLCRLNTACGAPSLHARAATPEALPPLACRFFAAHGIH